MTPTEFRSALAALGVTQAKAADLIGVHTREVQRWLAGKPPIPEPVARLVRRLVEEHEQSP